MTCVDSLLLQRYPNLVREILVRYRLILFAYRSMTLTPSIFLGFFSKHITID
uniref:Uncharacterized protein n=1 Tax=Arundo donax TaxID=35708 RepID=A0A0A9BG46_ARUDO